MPRKRRPNTPSLLADAALTAVPLSETARQRYLNYALSVITARALPDVRDGLKPVQRRILYSMYHNHRLTPDRPPIKSAKVVGSVIGEWHPHGDLAVYEAMARMAQAWSLRLPLVDGHGNFGSIDGDPPAAYRYTEARLSPLALELLSELTKDTVEMRPNYDGKGEEPVVLPARFPNLLVNGATGIAVGMATNIPPHNLEEVIDAAVTLIEHPDASTADLLKHVKGPDFPTGAEILNTRAELREFYETGSGTIRVRGEYIIEPLPGGKSQLVITSIPFALDKAALVERIGEQIASRRVPQLLDVRDESTADIRIVLELQKDADAQVAMAFLYKHTPLQSNFNANLTCLVPVSGSPVGRPECLGLKRILELFTRFRFETVTRRLRYDRRQLEQRIHILAGFQQVFDALDQVLSLIRSSDGKADAAAKLRQRFTLDAVQATAILEIPIYKLSRTEIRGLMDELADKRREAHQLDQLLGSDARLWDLVTQELREVASRYRDKRRTKVGRRQTEEVEFDPEAYRIREDATVTVSADGWVRRVGLIKDLGRARVREGDRLMAVTAGSTLDQLVFFSNYGGAYTMRIGDLPPARSGYGDPIQKFFKFKDGERVVAVYSLDPRVSGVGGMPSAQAAIPHPDKDQAVVVTSSGMGLRFELEHVREPSTRVGRRYVKLKEGEEVMGVALVSSGDMPALAVASRSGRMLLCSVDELPMLVGPGRGVTVIKLDGDDRVLGFRTLENEAETLTLVKEDNTPVAVSTRKYSLVSRGGKGVPLLKRGALLGVEPPDLVMPELPDTLQ